MTESDASLVARVRMGDTTAFEALLRRHFRAAYLVAFARVGERADAEDVCQEAFFKSWERIHECRDPGRFAAWLVRIVRNTAHNRREYLDVRVADSLDHVTPVASASRADRHTDQEELRATLQRALTQLPLVQREVVLLHDLEGWPHAELAVRLEISELMSRRHLSDARKRLRALLGDYADLMPNPPDHE
jgi:RNA polymerase sigma-70 factor, ECF subfamily